MSDGKVTISNVTVFLEIAMEAAATSLESFNASRTPTADGSGYILHGDGGKRVSFKQAMIAIAFSGVYLEALMSIATRQARSAGLRVVPKSKRYRARLEALGIKDQGLLADVDWFNDVRRDQIHEVSYELSTKPGAVNRPPGIKDFHSQDEAQSAVKVIERVRAALAEKYWKK